MRSPNYSHIKRRDGLLSGEETVDVEPVVVLAIVLVVAVVVVVVAVVADASPNGQAPGGGGKIHYYVAFTFLNTAYPREFTLHLARNDCDWDR